MMNNDPVRRIDDYIARSRSRIVEKTIEFIRVPSLSGAEGDVARYLEETLKDAGFEAFIDGAGNVVAGLYPLSEGSRPGSTLLFNVHLDTVPPGSVSLWKHSPYGGEIENGKIFGRGASDTKGAWSPMIIAMEAIRNLEIPLSGQVIFTASVMEEMTHSFGTRWLLGETLKDVQPDFVMLGEPTNLKVAIGHKGRAEVEITIRGTSCHASVPWNGENALYRAAPAISSLERFASELAGKHFDKLFGRSSIAVTGISTSPNVHNVIPDLCTIFADYRFLPGETMESIVLMVQEHLNNDGVFAEVAIGGRTEKTWTGVEYAGKTYMAAFDMDPEHPLVLAALNAGGSCLHKMPETFRWNFATDGAWTKGAMGIPTIGFSPCDESLAHVVDEYVEIDSMILAAGVYARIILKLLG